MVTEKQIDERIVAYRIREKGRGRTARKPLSIPYAGWRDILLRTYEEISEDRAGLAAAGVTFLGLLAIFPAIAVFVSIYSLIADVSTVQEHMDAMGAFIPQGAVEIIGSELQRLAAARETGLSLGMITGLLLTLWTANSGMKALFMAMNIAYDEKEKRGFFRLTLTSLLFTVGAIIAGILIVNALVILPVILNVLPLGPVASWITAIVPPVILFVIVNIGIALLYRHGPSRSTAQWSWVTAGSLITSTVWVIASLAFSFYLANFGNYNATYGTLGAVVGFMMWMYISAFVLLAGAELNAEIEHQTAYDTTIGPEKPMGERGAYVADTLGEKK